MSSSTHSNKVLKNLLESLEGNKCELQKLLNDYVTQVTTKTRDWMDDPSDKNMIFKEVVAMISAANMTLAEHINMISDTTASEMKALKPRDFGKDSKIKDITTEAVDSIIHRLDQLETKFFFLPNTKQLIEEILEENQGKDNLQSDLRLKIEEMSINQKLSFENCAQKLSEQDNRIKELTEEIESLKVKEKEVNLNKQFNNTLPDIKEMERVLMKMSEELIVNSEKINNMKQELKYYAHIIPTLQDSVRNVSFSKMASEKLTLKFGVICKILQQRLEPIEKIMHNINQNSVKRENKLHEYETTDDGDIKFDIDTIRRLQLKGYKIGFEATGGTPSYVHSSRSCKIRYSNVTCYIKSVYDRDKRCFIAPVDGLYTVSYTIENTAVNRATLWVSRRYHYQGLMKEETVCKLSCLKKDNYASTTCIVMLKSKDELLPYTTKAFLELRCTSFSCFLNDF